MKLTQSQINKFVSEEIERIFEEEKTLCLTEHRKLKALHHQLQQLLGNDSFKIERLGTDVDVLLIPQGRDVPIGTIGTGANEIEALKAAIINKSK